MQGVLECTLNFISSLSNFLKQMAYKPDFNFVILKIALGLSLVICPNSCQYCPTALGQEK